MYYPSFALLFLINPQQEVLLLRRINTPFCNNCYSLPGGKIDQGKPAMQSLCQEIKNSIGLEITSNNLEFVHVMHRKCNVSEFFACIFKLENFSDSPKNLEPERHDDMKWFSLDKLPENIVPAHKHAIEMINQSTFYSEHGWNIDCK